MIRDGLLADPAPDAAFALHIYPNAPAGVFVGKGSDLGGGCSTMGTLSGGGNIVISVGERCLIGANAGGSRLLKHGDVRHNLLGIEVVLAGLRDGNIRFPWPDAS